MKGRFLCKWFIEEVFLGETSKVGIGREQRKREAAKKRGNFRTSTMEGCFCLFWEWHLWSESFASVTPWTELTSGLVDQSLALSLLRSYKFPALPLSVSVGKATPLAQEAPQTRKGTRREGRKEVPKNCKKVQETSGRLLMVLPASWGNRVVLRSIHTGVSSILPVGQIPI